MALIGMLCTAFLAGRSICRNEKRRRITAAPFPDSWKGILQKNVSLYRTVPPSLRERLNNSIKLFVAEKRFEGCNGLVVTDEMRYPFRQGVYYS
jgi:Mlc titration factor MtfA (ptsG expression regulator)